jgi:hypothetical protein
MLINGLNKKISAIAAPTEFDKLARGGAAGSQSESLKPGQKYRGAKAIRKSRQRGKKG